MDAGLPLNGTPISPQDIHSSNAITVLCEAGCEAPPDGKPRRDSLQPRSEKEEDQAPSGKIESPVPLTVKKDKAEEGGFEGELLKSLLPSEPATGVVFHDSFQKNSTPNGQIANKSRDRHIWFNQTKFIAHPILRASKEKDMFNISNSDHRLINVLPLSGTQMYMPNNDKKASSELAAQKALNSFMKLASVCPILPPGAGVALGESDEMDSERMSVFDECNRYTFAFGGSMDASQPLHTGLQLRKDFDGFGRGGNGYSALSSKSDTVISKSYGPPPNFLPIRKSSLQRQSERSESSSLVDSGGTLGKERKKSPCFRLKSGFRTLTSFFRNKNPHTRLEDRGFSPPVSLIKPRLSTSSSESNASSRSKKTVRFQNRVPEAFEPAFLSAPVGGSLDRKSFLNSQFGQIQYNSNTKSTDLGNRSSSAGTDGYQHAMPQCGRIGSAPLGDLHSFPSFSEARTGIYQRVKGGGKGVAPETPSKMPVESSQETPTEKGASEFERIVKPDAIRYMDDFWE